MNESMPSPMDSGRNNQIVSAAESANPAIPEPTSVEASQNPSLEVISPEYTSSQEPRENLSQANESGPLSRAINRWSHWWQERQTRRVEAKLNKANEKQQALIDEAKHLRWLATLQSPDEARKLIDQAVAIEKKRDDREPRVSDLRQKDSQHKEALQKLETRINGPIDTKQAGYRKEVVELESKLSLLMAEIKQLEKQWKEAEEKKEKLKKEEKLVVSTQERAEKKLSRKKLKEENERRLNWIMRLKKETVGFNDRRSHLNYQILMLENRKAKRKDSQSMVDVSKLLS